ncbi:hypothetical protein GCM10020229_62960 [Kitasatospora albolonga]
MYCANAGVAPVGGADAGPAAWESAWQVNVLAHVRAAEHPAPRLAGARRGPFRRHVSAAGLLTSLVPPRTTRQQARRAGLRRVALRHLPPPGRAGARGLPAGRADQDAGGDRRAGQLLLADEALEPSVVAEEVMRGIAEERFLILPHPEVARY